MHRRRDDLPLTAEINVTSLVDVAFTLLVIFIITAPALQGGVEVDLPEANVRSISSVDDPFYVSVDDDGTIYLEDTPVTVEEFRSSLPQLLGANPPDQVYIRGDRAAVWETMMVVIGEFSQLGINPSLVALPEPPGR